MALNADQHTGPGAAIILSAEPVQAHGTVIVVREKVKDAAADGTGTVSSSTVYADTVTGEVHGAAELLRADAVAGIRSRVTGVPANIAGPSPPDPALADVLLDPAGELQVTTEGPAAPGRAGEKVTTIDARDTGAALSDFGRKVLGQLSAAAVEPPATAPALRHVNCDLVPCAALTYDDGPDAKATPQLLGILKEKNARGTFFMTGSSTAANPATARQVSDAGHAVGNHTFSHPYLTKLSAAAARNEIDRADAAIRAATGSSPSFMRPPYGAADAAVQAGVGKPLILWAVDSLDWQSKNPAVFVPKVLKEITPGAVVLMHDVHPTTIAGQVELITGLQAQGYHLVTVPVENDETVLLELIATVAQIADGAEVCWATDLNAGGAALLIELLAAHAQQLLYIPGRIVHHAAATYRGDGKTDAKDARIIADQARMRTDLQPVRGADQISVDLRMLTARRTDLICDRVRAINRLRATLLEYFPALERAFDYSKKAPLILLIGYQTPEGIRRTGLTRLTSWLRKRGCRNSAKMAEKALEAANAQHTVLPTQSTGSALVVRLAG